jgi:hypothetical protein
VSCSSLKLGYGVQNTLDVAFDGDKNYTFSVNGTQVLPFTDTNPIWSKGTLGFDVGVLSVEDFPSIPVSVSYTVNTPTGMSFPSLNVVAVKSLEIKR